MLINGKAAATQADVKNRYPDGSVKYAVISIVIPEIPSSRPLTLTFDNQPSGNNEALSRDQMLAAAGNFDAQMILTGPSGVERTADARQMLENGNYKLWTSGPIAQTVILADDTASRKYDLGFDKHRPFRPRFYVTFWPATRQVAVRYVGENGNTEELEDLSYTLALTIGNDHRPVYKKSLTHYAMSNWTKLFWFGSTPTPKVDIDYNLRYLVSTRFLPNYDTSINVPGAAIAADYRRWTNSPHDLYDGVHNHGLWQNRMGTAGERPDIGPYPQWTVLWFYTGDWRMRQMALGMAALASAWPANLREADPTKNLLRTDPAGARTGLGHTVSISSRPTFVSSQLTYDYTKPQDKVKIVGPVGVNQQWVFDGAHQPSPFYPQYILTGDPYYLNEMYMWAGFSAASYNGAATTYPYGRGPTGAEGVINDELRGAGWVLRNRAETAFAAPDGDPEKKYFTALTNDAIARWEGGFGITGTGFEKTPEWQWGHRMGDAYSCNGGPVGCRPPPLRNWESNCSSDRPCATVTNNEKEGIFVPGAVGSFTAPWMQFYVLYGLGRTGELGFRTEALLAWSAPWMTGMINRSGHPTLTANYQLPVERHGGGYFATWHDVVAALTPKYFSTLLPPYFEANLKSDGREIWATPGLSYLYDQPGGAQAWDWWEGNAYRRVRDFGANPRWAIVPRGAPTGRVAR